MKKKKVSSKEKKLKKFIKQGGHEGSKKDFFDLLKRSAQSLRA